MFYTVPGSVPLLQLLNDALILAHQTGHDVFNALDCLENAKVRPVVCGVGKSEAVCVLV